MKSIFVQHCYVSLDGRSSEEDLSSAEVHPRRVLRPDSITHTDPNSVIALARDEKMRKRLISDAKAASSEGLQQTRTTQSSVHCSA
ncbi:hypothetical protein CEXT_598321 [Caerostris extrusa]|uniref:Uncharacterized protein n=1 Tax=Caerostris extrusa TaxID=172846 RepID=A0AAV4N9T5_CAEEX|nr:hypothetical protein CEXT_598321 [Caerostris extrusa]